MRRTATQPNRECTLQLEYNLFRRGPWRSTPRQPKNLANRSYLRPQLVHNGTRSGIAFWSKVSCVSERGPRMSICVGVCIDVCALLLSSEHPFLPSGFLRCGSFLHVCFAEELSLKGKGVEGEEGDEDTCSLKMTSKTFCSPR